MNNEHSRTPDEVQDLRLDCIESDNDALWPLSHRCKRQSGNWSSQTNRPMISDPLGLHLSIIILCLGLAVSSSRDDE